MKTALLQKVTARAAERLTGTASAGAILEQLSRDHYFTAKHVQTDTLYQYHPLFRDFLLARARRTFSRPELSALRTSAATLMEESGQIEEAARLFIDALEWDGLARVILAHAPVLLSQGRSATLEGWLKALPRAMIDGSPWMLHWYGICRMPFNPGGSRGHLERAFESFRTRGDMTGALLSWASIIDTFLYEWSDFSRLDHWSAVLEALLSEHPVFPSPRSRPGSPRGCSWRWRGRTRSIPPRVLGGEGVRCRAERLHVQLRVMLANHLAFHHLWSGDFAKTRIVLDTLRPLARMPDNDPLTQQTWWVMEAMYSWVMADLQTCLAAVTEGNRPPERSGHPPLDVYLNAQGVYAGVSPATPRPREGVCAAWRAGNPSRPLDRSLHHDVSAQIAWMVGDRPRRTRRHAVSIARSTGVDRGDAVRD